MSQDPKFNKNYLYSSKPSMNNAFPAFSATVNAPDPRYSQNFPHPSINRQSSSAYVAYSTSASTSTSNALAPHAYSPSSTSSTYASVSASAGDAAADYVLPAKTRHHKYGFSSRLSQASCSSDTCSQPSLPPSPTPFDMRPTQKWLSQLRYDIPVKLTAQGTKGNSDSFRDREVSGRINRSASRSSSPTPTSVGSSSSSRGRPRVGGLYEIDYIRPKRRPCVSKETRKKEITERQAIARQSAGRQTAESPTADEEERKRKKPEDWKEWQTDEKH
ncbi:uncharacterized protein Bfra_005934 [Botrytis fragariae]|uniref:Uncharacterized protein n=1 Tax=Botrytis fragariae TaxID=1964551 RepID=A0A8H6ARE8_9HELO|nr:uncharacterized protein Bfra_005934 [Botrytis fragariae]KAF5872573.1 hypothetical protein Bfra_005934 [Botrytis fragariae]